MTSKLLLANGALRLLKERQLTLSELTTNAREPARNFNAIWEDGALDDCLEAGQWKFASRTVRLDASPSVVVEFGFQYAFEKPGDFVRTIGMWSDDRCTSPLRDCREEGGYWFTNQETIFVTYVSNDAAFGGDMSLWPPGFTKFVQAHIASEIAGPLASEGVEILKLRKMQLTDALSTDAMADPSRSLPVGSWVKARAGGMRNGGQNP